MEVPEELAASTITFLEIQELLSNYINQHGLLSHKIWIFIITTVRTQDLTLHAGRSAFTLQNYGFYSFENNKACCY